MEENTELKNQVAELLQKKSKSLLKKWVNNQLKDSIAPLDLISSEELERQSGKFLTGLLNAIKNGNFEDLDTEEFLILKDTLDDTSSFFIKLGFSPSETAIFIFSLKDTLLSFFQNEFKSEVQHLTQAVIMVNRLLDKLGLYTFESYSRGREEIILQQQQDMIELSNPIIKVWDNIVALPIIGTLDSARTQVIMEGILTKLVETNSMYAIIDISGVPTVDTLIAQHLIKTAKAIQLMGAECIISGIRPEIAQTIVHMGIDISNVKSKATMEAALKSVFMKTGTLGEKIETPEKASL